MADGGRELTYRMRHVDVPVLLEIATRAAAAGAAVLLDYYSRPASGVSSKSSPTDLVSAADHDSEAAILSVIRSERPRDGILSEEGGGVDARSGLTWVVDPLDGTINFLYRIPAWCISLAVEDVDGGLIGVVHDPLHGETFTAIRGAGAALNGHPITVGDKDDIATALVATGFSYDAAARAQQAARLPALLPRVRDLRRGGSASLDLCYVAAGRFDGYFEAPMGPWDKAAGQLIAAEAGARVRRLRAPQDLSPGVVAACPGIFDALVSLLNE